MAIEQYRSTSGALLPPYRAVFAVDAEKFSRNADRHQQTLGQAIPDVLHEAFERSALADVWKDARFPRHNGDGYVIGMEPEYLPHLVHPLLGQLQDVLHELNPRLAFENRELRLRLRASIDVGPLPDTGGLSNVDAMGEAMVNTHRLLDAEQVKTELARSHPETTFVAAIVSRRVYEDVVLGGFGGVHESRLRAVNVHQPEKEFAAEGYLYVPIPSTKPGAEPESDAEQEQSPQPHPQSRTTEVRNQFNNYGQSRENAQLGDNYGTIRIGGGSQQ